MSTLRGITWMHSRGNLPVMATAQRYMEMHPDISIVWESRSLQAFGDYPIDRLADEYDLIVLDHPWMGFADRSGALLPLEKYLPADYLADQQENTVGRSFESYFYNGHQYALAIDAACPIASYSPSKMKKLGAALPEDWKDVLALARDGQVTCAGNATSLLMQFYMFCATATDDIFTDEKIADREVMLQALENICELFALLPKDVFGKNPIAAYETLAAEDRPEAYCPCDFGYSNYSRPGYADHLVLSTDVVKYNGKMLKTTLGGAGIAISAHISKESIVDAIDYVKYTASGKIQRSIYAETGGQPGHRAAWLDQRVNQITNGFFENTLKTIDHAFLRPRYCGYLGFQEESAARIRDWVMNGGDPNTLIDWLTQRYLCSRKE